MVNILFAIIVFTGLLILLFASVMAGRLFGKWRLNSNPEGKLGVVGVAEGAVFALFGLLVAFTFSGAYERFEARKIHIIDEANVAETAYLRIGLLASETQTHLRDTFRQYMDARILIYKNIPSFESAMKEVDHSLQLRAQLWNEALVACKLTNNVATTTLVISSINKMFEIATTRFFSTFLHSPIPIFVLLIGLGMLSSFLAGYSTAAKPILHSIHIFSYVIITSLTLYIVIDLELPRVGLIRVDYLDFMLVQARNSMT